MLNFYELLEIPIDASMIEIKQAYKKMVHVYHPDINKEKGASEKFKEVVRAYKILSNPAKRMEYDKTIVFEKNKIKEEKRNFDNRKEQLVEATIEKTKKIKFLFSEIFSKKKLDEFFLNLKKARSELKRKRFIERERNKIIVDDENDFYEKITEIELNARLRSSGNQFVRAHAAKIIGNKRDKKFFFELVRALSDTSYIVRKEAVIALGKIKDMRAVNFIINTTYDYEKEVKISAVKVLRNFEDIRSINALLNLMGDSDDEIVSEAVYSLGVIGDEDVMPEIRKMLKHPSMKVKKAVLEVIKILRN